MTCRRLNLMVHGEPHEGSPCTCPEGKGCRAPKMGSMCMTCGWANTWSDLANFRAAQHDHDSTCTGRMT